MRNGILLTVFTAFLLEGFGIVWAAGSRQPVATFHLSFEDTAFFKDEIIAQSGRKTLSERKIDFPEGRFGAGIRMNSIPVTPDQDNMSGIDLDMITSLIFNTRPHTDKGFNEPFFWGSGKLNPRLGAVAFWAKGEPPFAWPLFEQTSNAFGRKERDLIGIELDSSRKISAYVRDARYVRHELKTDVIWDTGRWNHVALNWDWANGLELWMNGQKIASSWGKDAWFETMHPGPLHLPTAGIVYDELWLFDRPISSGEIKRLMTSNRAPDSETAGFRRDSGEMTRAARASGADRNADFPSITPDAPLTVTEIWPVEVSDGHIPGWHVLDGRYEMAWPHEYAFFTIIPGDGDFHAEKVDIKTRPRTRVNYVTLAGNLTGVRVQAGSPDMRDVEDVFAVPEGNRFFYGRSVDVYAGSTFRIPFVTGYGTPEGYQGDLNLPLTGDKRVHEVALYNVSRSTAVPAGETLAIVPYSGSMSGKGGFAFRSITARDERSIGIASSRKGGSGAPQVHDIGAFRRLNILTEPAVAATGVGAVTLSLPVTTLSVAEALFIRVHDPAVPSRLWNQFALNLKGFDSDFKTLKVTIDFQDLMLAAGERLWIDVGSAGSCKVLLGDDNRPADVTISRIAPYVAVDEYAAKEIIAAQSQYSKMYEFMPWKFTESTVDLERPYSFGGPFDIIYPALAIKRFRPDHFQANFFEIMAGRFYADGGTGWPADPSKVPLKTLSDPHGAPDWAVYMRDYQTFRHRIADWWRVRQNPDGQLGGGWNDDTLFMSFHMADLPLDGNDNARAIIDTVHTKIEDTRLFKDGYCRIYPIDRLHTGDFISERYNTVVNNLGQAYAAEREMESAWHSGHPERTPVNYYDRAFMSSVNVLNWYWGIDVPKEPYISKPLSELTKEMRLYSSAQNDYTFYRYTEARVMTDDFMPYGSYETYEYLMGGKRGARVDAHLKLAVMWPSGGGPDVSRLVLKADDASLRAVCYSFDNVKRDLEMRLCRIRDGRYRVSILKDPGGQGNGGETLWSAEHDLRRFDVVTLPIPPRTPVVITVEQLREYPRSADLADLVIDPWDANLQGTTVTAVVHNLGNAPAKDVVVRLLDGTRTVQEKVIPNLGAPVDYEAKRTTIRFEGVTPSRGLRVLLDPGDAVKEILESNNAARVRR